MRPQSMIASYVVRLFHTDLGPWRVTVRHVQSGEERQFASLAEAAAFMELNTANTQSNTAPREEPPWNGN